MPICSSVLRSLRGRKFLPSASIATWRNSGSSTDRTRSRPYMTQTRRSAADQSQDSRLSGSALDLAICVTLPLVRSTTTAMVLAPSLAPTNTSFLPSADSAADLAVSCAPNMAASSSAGVAANAPLARDNNSGRTPARTIDLMRMPLGWKLRWRSILTASAEVRVSGRCGVRNSGLMTEGRASRIALACLSIGLAAGTHAAVPPPPSRISTPEGRTFRLYDNVIMSQPAPGGLRERGFLNVFTYDRPFPGAGTFDVNKPSPRALQDGTPDETDVRNQMVQICARRLDP